MSFAIAILALIVVAGVAFMLTGVVTPHSYQPAHRATTAHSQALYPFQTSGGLGGNGCYIGQEVLGGSFCYDSWELYRTGKLTNPNMVVAGQIGRGKSALVKTMVMRETVFGRRAVIIDPKGEFGPLADATRGTYIQLHPGSGVGINPLDPGPYADELDPVELGARQDEMLLAIVSTALNQGAEARSAGPAEVSALGVAREHATRGDGVATLNDVVNLLLAPTEEMAAEVGASVEEFRQDAKDVGHVLRSLVRGHLRGMFDGQTTVKIDWESPVVVIDLSKMTDNPDAVGVVMAALIGWLHPILARTDDVQRRLVLDEAWYLLSNLALARWLRAMFKFSRQYGLSNTIVVHRMSDLEAAGGEGSEATRIAQGLLSDTETRVVYAQAAGEVADAARLLGLNRTETGQLSSLPKGTALWNIGGSGFLVEHVIGGKEWEVIDTDQAMRADPEAYEEVLS